MKKQLLKVFVLLCYLMGVSLLFNFNWMLFFKPKPFFSVILGLVILTACQYKKQYTKEDVIASLRWNLAFASFITTLVSILSSVTPEGLNDINVWLLVESLLPLLYGILINLIISIAVKEPVEGKTNREAAGLTDEVHDLTVTSITDKVFRELGLTNRECHVALKMLNNISNKEIASDLFISEATVKKHVQNIYQKFSANDRNSFREIYIKSAEKKQQS
ncbi:MAG: helix-turn-helix transcriptional regulator [Clostridiaceae bacterium]